MSDRSERQVRSIPSNFETREDSEELRIEGYFAVFNSNYEIFPGWTESIAPGAFTDTLSGDIRALIDHETRLVLGRTSAHTLELREDGHGLWGSIIINPKDVDAMNLYERVKRGDVNQCSFGFSIEDEEYEHKEDGSEHWTIKKVKLYEVSICTFPAYTDTNVKARKDDLDAIRERKKEAWRKSMLAKLKGGN
jgi:HK97 family phage prohead protease